MFDASLGHVLVIVRTTNSTVTGTVALANIPSLLHHIVAYITLTISNIDRQPKKHRNRICPCKRNREKNMEKGKPNTDAKGCNDVAPVSVEG